MRVDERAWLGIADAKYAIDAKHLKVDFTAKNVGKSPAITVFSNVAWVGKPRLEIANSRYCLSIERHEERDDLFSGASF